MVSTATAGPRTWRLWAARVGRGQRQVRENFLSPGSRSGPVDIDFMVWIAQCGDHVAVVDTGFDREAGHRRGRFLETRPADAVRELGVDPSDIRHVVLTHLHYDHAGNISDFPAAEVVVQRAELAYASGGAMRYPATNHFFEADDVVRVVRRVFDGTVRVPDGDVQLAPGLELHLVGGHTRGLQVVRVHTARGWVVLASDAAHYYENLAERNPFPALVDTERALDAFDRISRLASSPDHIVPGHDPQVFRRYPTAAPGREPALAALHQPPEDPR